MRAKAPLVSPRVDFRTLLLAAAMLSACIDTDVRRDFKGHLDSTAFRLDRAEAIALSSDGRQWRVPLGDDLNFRFTLRTDRTYEFRFANGTAVPGVLDEFAFLTHTLPDGTRSRVFVMEDGPTINLGQVRPIGFFGSSESALRPTSDDADEDSDSSGSFGTGSIGGTVESEPAEICELAGGADMVEVQGDENVPNLGGHGNPNSNSSANRTSSGGQTAAPGSPVCMESEAEIDAETGCDCHRWGKNNNGHGNNMDGVDISNPGAGSGGPNGEVDLSAPVDDENKGPVGGVGGANPCSCICARRAKNNNGHGNNCDRVDISNPGQGGGGPNGMTDVSAPIDDEKHQNC